MILNERDARHEHILQVARQMKRLNNYPIQWLLWLKSTE